MKYIVQRTMLPRKHNEEQQFMWWPYAGNCLQGFGIPSKGRVLTDTNIVPEVGDFIVCAKTAGANSAFLKKIIQKEER